MKRALKDLTSAAADHFSYLIVYAPDFPKEDETNAGQECERLLQMLHEIEERAAETPKKQWLRLAVQEVVQARERFRGDDARAANDSLHSAEEHFKAYLGGKRGKATFVADPGGIVERIDD